MINSPILDTILSLVVIYFLLSNLVIALNEIVMHWFESRARFLQKQLNSVFNDKLLNKNFTLLLYDNPNIDVLKRTIKKFPHYIAAENFTAALIDVITKEAIKTTFVQDAITKEFKVIETGLEAAPMERFIAGVEGLNHSDLKELLRSFITHSYNSEKNDYDFGLLNKVIINWYNSYMERVSGWFKSWRKPFTFILSIIVAIVLNVDSISLIKNLFTNKTLRDKLVQKAYTIAENETYGDYLEVIKADSNSLNKLKENLNTQDSAIRYATTNGLQADSSQYNETAKKLFNERRLLLAKRDSSHTDSTKLILLERNLHDALAQIEELNLPIGWKSIACDDCSIGDKARLFIKANKSHLTFQTYLGWLITSFALMLGAPFWFDVIKNLVNIRSSGKNPIETNKK